MLKEKNKIKNLQEKPPVVVVLGHVDHGKSSILEKIKDLKITEKESGGITQHIGAYEIEHQDKKITFIDTPGHAAFAAMRSRGAKIADIAILVIAGEEGIKPQTKEAILHIKQAGLPFIVALNKIDRPEANPKKIKEQLTKQDVVPEEMGGKVPCVETSAVSGKGIPELLEMVLLLAEMENLKTDFSLPAEGTIIESYLDPKRGPTSTLILQNGALKKGDILGTGSASGKIKIMEDFQGKSIDKAQPSTPVVVIGFEKTPGAGEKFKSFNSLKKAEEKTDKSKRPTPKIIEIKPEQKILNLILKADVWGSLEAIERALKEIPQEKVVLRILKTGVGEINESDIKLAGKGKALVAGFRVKIPQTTRKLALRNNVKILTFEVIYDLVQKIRELLEKMVVLEITKKELGKVEILAIFKTEKNKQIIGGKVKEGRMQKDALINIFREEEKIGEGKIISLKKDQNEIGQVEKGKECGMLYKGDVEIKEGDVLEAYINEKIKTGL